MRMLMSSPFHPQDTPEGEQDVHYQLRVTLFDRNHQQFFGKTWKSRPERIKNSRIPFAEVCWWKSAVGPIRYDWCKLHEM